MIKQHLYRKAAGLIRIGLLALLPVIPGLSHAWEIGEEMGNGRYFLFDEPVESYSNGWSAALVLNEEEYFELHIRGEGKTTTFNGILGTTCKPGALVEWVVAVDFGAVLSDGAIADTVPAEVLANARSLYCG